MPVLFLDRVAECVAELSAQLDGHTQSVSIAALLSLAVVLMKANPHQPPPEVTEAIRAAGHVVAMLMATTPDRTRES